MAHLTSVEPWEVAYFNGAALLDEIPVGTRDTHEQYALRDRCQLEPPEVRKCYAMLPKILINYIFFSANLPLASTGWV